MFPVHLSSIPLSCTAWTYADQTHFVASIDPRWATSAPPPMESFGQVIERLKNQEEEILSFPQGQNILRRFPANPQNPLFYFQREKWLDAYNKIQFWRHLPGGADYLKHAWVEGQEYTLAQELEEWMVKRPEVLNLKSLRIAQGTMTRLPPEIGRCQQLTHFMMMNTLLQELPPQFGALVNLQEVFLSNNRLRCLCPGFQNLQKLERLEITNNRLENIDPVGLLKNLQTLYASKNQICRLPPFLQWEKFEALDLGYNQISELSEGFYQMPSLTLLMLNDNQISRLSERVCQFLKLDSLFLENNKLTELPLSLGRMPKLRSISFAHNQVLEIPLSLAGAPSLIEIVFKGNPLQYRPAFLPARIWTDVI